MKYMLFKLIPLLFFFEQHVSKAPFVSATATVYSHQPCQVVTQIQEVTNAGCESPFVKRFGNNGISEECYYLTPDGEGNYFIAGSDGDKSLILQIDPSGNILIQRTYDFTNGSDFIPNLMVDDEGFVVGSARDQLNTNTTNVLFKINWQTGNLVWARTIDNPSYNRFDRVFQHPSNGNYIFCGLTTSDNYIIESNKNTGNVSWQFVSDYAGNADVYSGYFATANAIFYAGQGRLGAGLDEIRPTLSKFDLNGNLQWAKIHLRSPNQPSRLYNMDLFIDNDTIVNCGRGTLSGDDLTNSQLLFYKTNINGNLIWAKSYSITGGTGVAGYGAHPIPGGYIVQGTYDEGGFSPKFFIARLNKSGSVVWAKQINASAAGITKSLVVVDGDFVVFAAQTTQYDLGQNNDILFGKIPLDGDMAGTSCPLVQDINLVANNISNPYDGSQVPLTFSATFTFPISSHSPLTSNLSASDIPGCECEAFSQDSCDLQIAFKTDLACPFLFDGEITASPSGGTPPYTYAWETGTSTTNLLAGLDVGTYSVTVTDANGCAVVDSVELTAATRPEVSSEVQDASCFGVNDGTLMLLTNDPTLQFVVQAAPPSPQTFYENLWPGGDQYFVVDTFGCLWVQFYFIDAPDKITVNLPNTIEAEMCDPVQLNASSSTSPLIFSWTPTDNLSCTDCPNPVANPFSTTTYYLTVQDSNGCTASDSIRVLVNFQGKAFIPNAFSPNGDGLNDVLYVLSRCVTEVRMFRVFDRWGELVFENSNTPPNDPLYGWNGKFRGKDINTDVFVYNIVVVLADGSLQEYKGDVTLLR